MEIDKQLRRSALLIAQLDAIMRKRFRDRPDMPAQWRSASRIEPVVRWQAARVVALPAPGGGPVALLAPVAEAPVLAPETAPQSPMRVKVIRARCIAVRAGA